MYWLFSNINHAFIEMTERFVLINDDCLHALKYIRSSSVDMIFADPPYFLSHGGITCKSGEIACVDKGEWDKEKDRKKIDEFNYCWIKECKRILKKDGTIWITGTFHNIYSVGQVLHYLDFKILNSIVWQKEAPPPNMSKRMFTHSHEYIIWAKKSPQSRHYFNYEAMVKENKGKQVTDVWTIPHVPLHEKTFGYHPTQKPLKLLNRIIIASTKPQDIILDPFCGSGTTGVSALSLNRKFVGIEQEQRFINLAKQRIDSVYKVL
jgi:site-specific DNA-methyltransferase (adenine-specific)